jgi:hypothetical protein
MMIVRLVYIEVLGQFSNDDRLDDLLDLQHAAQRAVENTENHGRGQVLHHVQVPPPLPRQKHEKCWVKACIEW